MEVKKRVAVSITQSMSRQKSMRMSVSSLTPTTSGQSNRSLGDIAEEQYFSMDSEMIE